jgi:glutamate-1-semialdehyde 2,1-aminomutase
MHIKNSEQLFQRAQKSIPGGVNSPVRAFKSVEIPFSFKKPMEPIYMMKMEMHT